MKELSRAEEASKSPTSTRNSNLKRYADIIKHVLLSTRILARPNETSLFYRTGTEARFKC